MLMRNLKKDYNLTWPLAYAYVDSYECDSWQVSGVAGLHNLFDHLLNKLKRLKNSNLIKLKLQSNFENQLRLLGNQIEIRFYNNSNLYL